MKDIPFVLFLIFYFLLPLLLLLYIRSPRIKKAYAVLGLVVFIPILIIGVFSHYFYFKNGQLFFVFKISGLWCEKTFDCTMRVIARSDAILNSIMLFPIGLVVGVFTKKPIRWSLVCGLLMGGFIELAQCLLPISRFPQIADMLLNAFSVLLGGIYVCLINLFKKYMFLWSERRKIKKRLNSGDTFLPKEKEYCKIVLGLDIPETCIAQNIQTAPAELVMKR